MKKLSLLLLLLTVLFTFAACNDQDGVDDHTHEYGAWSVSIAPGCNTSGEEIRTCECGATETRKLAATKDHDFGTGTKCTVCQSDIVYTKELVYEWNEEEAAYAVIGLDNTALKAVYIPASYLGKPVTAIGENAFYNCTALTKIQIPDCVTEIGEYAFAGKHDSPLNLSAVYIGANSRISRIGDNAFQYCTALTGIQLPPLVTYIGANAFSGCSALSSFTVPDAVTEIGYGAFSGCTALTAFTLPDAITTLPGNLFSGCTALKTVSLPNTLTAIGSSAFLNCTALTAITLPEALLSIEHSAFENCTALGELLLPASLTTLQSNAFFGCGSISSVAIPANVTRIGANAFANCKALADVTFAEQSGWSATDIADDTLTPFSSSQLSEPDTACAYLKSAYANCTWSREIN